jgi:DNA-binding response OmpR family regulator
MDGETYDVLIVEDDPLVADALEAGVMVAGYGVCGTASDADSAVDKMALHRPQLAIIDVDLGAGGDGVEAARRMLAVAPIGIMFVTGYPDRARAADVGDAWMPKPLRVLDLINALEVLKAVSERRRITTPIPPQLSLIH